MIRKSLLAVALLALLRGTALAAPITVNEVLYDPSGVADPLLLSGTVDMVYSEDSHTLQIVLTNTSANAAGSAAGVLLTGLGFSLPTGVSILGGTANIGTSTAINFTAPVGGNVSSEWGYENSPLHSGAFLNDGSYSYNTVVASMMSMTSFQFAPGSISQPINLGGPDFGLISAAETDAGGQQAIRDSIRITLNLSGDAPSSLVSWIDSNPVGLSFGSPSVSVPEPASLSLLAIGAVMLGIRRRRQQ
jgi:PEP-CTERM motif-containing protein